MCICVCDSTLYRFGGGFTEWSQPFRLRHMVTGRFLGVKSISRANCPTSCLSGGGEGGEEGGREGRRPSLAVGTENKCIAVLLEPSEASFKTSAFCFTDATVSSSILILRMNFIK